MLLGQLANLPGRQPDVLLPAAVDTLAPPAVGRDDTSAVDVASDTALFTRHSPGVLDFVHGVLWFTEIEELPERVVLPAFPTWGLGLDDLAAPTSLRAQ